MIAWFAIAAAWGSGQVVVVEDTLVPGRIATLQIARSPVQATTRPPGEPPAQDLSDLRLSGAQLLRTRSVRAGVTDLEVVPDPGSPVVEVRLGSERFRFPVAESPVTPLRRPGRVVGTAPDEAVFFTLTSTTAPRLRAEELRLVASEGQLSLGPGRNPDDLAVTLQPDPSSVPRVVPVAVIDLRADRRPAVVPVVLRARPRLNVKAAPGSSVTLTLGRRAYGPVTVPDSGVVGIRVDQYPGESLATVRASDDLGNTTTSELPLATSGQPSLLVLPTGLWLPGAPPPPIHVVALRPNGAPWPETPRCEVPRTSLPLRQLEPGWWTVDLPNGGDPWRDAREDLRVACTVSDVTRTARVQQMVGVPERVGLSVGPRDLRSDYPIADVRAEVEDSFGDRVDLDGLTVTAEHGALDLVEQGRSLRGEYRGHDAVEPGSDTVTARYRRPAGPGPVTALELGFGDVPGLEGGSFLIHARALNARGAPVAYVPLRLMADGQQRSVMTQANGWASTKLDVPAGRRPRVVSAAAAVVSRNALALPGEAGIGGPERPDLQAEATVRVRAGRFADVSVTAEPQVLRAGPGSVATVVVRLVDRSGRPVIDESVRLEASEGRVLPAYARPDGTMVAQFVPDESREARVAKVSAAIGDFRSSTEVTILAAPSRGSVGPFLGVQSNLGELQSLLLGLDADFRTRALRDSLVIRFGFHGTRTTDEATLPGFAEAEIRSTVTSLDLGAALRDDRGPLSLWLGVGGTVAIQWSDIRFDMLPKLEGRDLLGGLMVYGGLSRRALLGEWLIEARGYLVPATAAPDIGYTGNLGGLSVGVGYRLVY